ncbi:hypothetical protein [Wolbachia endosymbiont of Tettigetta isshikii]|uniref:hypothetical protein n=1 Tax=Wolbachia endosymbiont of Tettigetta isshikii TaxID=3239093 RepID=UPI0039817A60
MSQTTIQTYREIGLVYLDKNGCNTNFFSVAHAHDNSIPIVSMVIFLSYLFYITFLTYNFFQCQRFS